VIRRTRATAALLLGVGVVLATTHLAAQDRPAPLLRRYTLGNGLRLLVLPNTSSEIVSIVALCRVGPADEGPNPVGLAALTAEAMIRGTRTRPGRAYADLVLRAGGNLQAVQRPDFAEFTLVTDRARWEPAVKLLADVIAHPALGAEEIQAAREALRRRQISSQDDFGAASYQALLKALYGRTPYGAPILGTATSLARFGVQDVQQFWQANYHQMRITVAIVGNVDAAAVAGVAQKEFADVPFRTGSARRPPAAPPLRQPEVTILERPGSLAQVAIGYLLPPVSPTELPVRLVLEALLGGGKRSRLFIALREKHGLGYDLGTSYAPLVGQSHLVTHVITSPYRLNPATQDVENVLDGVKRIVLEELRAVGRGEITDAELARARSFAIGRGLLRLERTRDHARWLAWNEALGLGLGNERDFAARIQAVTKEQVQAAAKELLNPYALVVTVPASQ